MQKIQSIRGMNDYLPEDVIFWQYIEKKLQEVLISYGYHEIRFPILEKTLLFQRAIGEITDVVKKEMYSFMDHHGNNLTLRPEGTAGCMRASIESNIFYNKKNQRLWYLGPMFRYERPQKGRYRQFHQLGVEVFGQNGPEIDAELIVLTARWWKILGINKNISLELNSIGSLENRIFYCKILNDFFLKNINFLDEDCQKQIKINPMRILDKNSSKIKNILKDAPLLTDYLDKDSSLHFSNLCKLLDLIGIKYVINPYLVRGLDYYNNTVFEWITKKLGSQDTICAGGRYDNLSKQLGYNQIPAIGCAVGLERLILLTKEINVKIHNFNNLDIYFVTIGDNAKLTSITLSELIRDKLPSLKLINNYSINNLRKQFTYANKHGARIILLLGNNELNKNEILIKDLTTGIQEYSPQNQIIIKLKSIFKL